MLKRLTNKVSIAFKYLKSNAVFYSGLLISLISLLYGSTLISIPFDNQVKNEITNIITKNAQINPTNYSFNSLEISQSGNSDYWIYSDNNLQNFQMRNQQFDGIRSYIFAAYKPTNGHVAFKYKDYDTTTILFESKFEANNFYFDLPLIYGSLPRYIEKNSIYITDTFAQKIIENNETFEDLINKSISGTSIGASGKSNQMFNIRGVFDTKNNLGTLLVKNFGENIVFIPEYNTFQMKGALYFIGSTNYTENKVMVDFIFDNYKTVQGYSRNLATGYSLKFSFYDYNENTNRFVLDKSNEIIGVIIETYSEQGTIYFVMGSILFLSNLVILIVATVKNQKKITLNGKVLYLLIIWIVSSVALLLVSIANTYFPIMSIISNQLFTTHSGVTSAILFLSWLGSLVILTAIPLLKKSNDIRN